MEARPTMQCSHFLTCWPHGQNAQHLPALCGVQMKLDREHAPPHLHT